jgi:hypothetical protein
VRIHPSVSRETGESDVRIRLSPGKWKPISGVRVLGKESSLSTKEVLLSESLWCLWGIARIEHLHASNNFEGESKTTANYSSVILLIPINERERERERGTNEAAVRYGDGECDGIHPRFSIWFSVCAGCFSCALFPFLFRVPAPAFST